MSTSPYPTQILRCGSITVSHPLPDGRGSHGKSPPLTPPPPRTTVMRGVMDRSARACAPGVFTGTDQIPSSYLDRNAMAGTCVVGLQWGDEAKGKIVDLLGDQFDFVV